MKIIKTAFFFILAITLSCILNFIGVAKAGVKNPTNIKGTLGNLSPDASYRGTHSWERVGYCLSGVGDV